MAQEEGDEYRAAKGVGGRSLSKVAETKEQRKARRERLANEALIGVGGGAATGSISGSTRAESRSLTRSRRGDGA